MAFRKLALPVKHSYLFFIVHYSRFNGNIMLILKKVTNASPLIKAFVLDTNIPFKMLHVKFAEMNIISKKKRPAPGSERAF